jgi:hypothetical protein
MPRERSTDPEQRAYRRCLKVRRRLAAVRESLGWYREAGPNVKFARECHLATCCENLAEALTRAVVPLDGDFEEDDA